MTRKNFALISLVLIVIVGVSEVSMRPYLQDRVISRDASGLLHKLGIKELSDLRFIRIYTKDQQILELAPAESREDMRGILAYLASADRGAVFGCDPEYEICLVLKNGKHAAINVYKDHITTVFGECRYESPGLEDRINAIARKSVPWITNAHLRTSTVSYLQADFADGRRVRSQRDNGKDERAQRTLSLALQILESVDRRNLQSLDRIREEARSEPTIPLSPRASPSSPAVYLEFNEPFRETVIMRSQSMWAVSDDEIVYSIKEDSFMIKKAAIYSEQGRVLVALIPTSGKPWYVYGGDWLDDGLAQEWKDRLNRYGPRSVPAHEKPSAFPDPYRSMTDLYGEMAALLRSELDSKTTD